MSIEKRDDPAWPAAALNNDPGVVLGWNFGGGRVPNVGNTGPGFVTDASEAGEVGFTPPKVNGDLVVAGLVEVAGVVPVANGAIAGGADVASLAMVGAAVNAEPPPNLKTGAAEGEAATALLVVGVLDDVLVMVISVAFFAPNVNTGMVGGVDAVVATAGATLRMGAAGAVVLPEVLVARVGALTLDDASGVFFAPKLKTGWEAVVGGAVEVELLVDTLGVALKGGSGDDLTVLAMMVVLLVVAGATTGAALFPKLNTGLLLDEDTAAAVVTEVGTSLLLPVNMFDVNGGLVVVTTVLTAALNAGLATNALARMGLDDAAGVVKVLLRIFFICVM